MDGKQYYTLLPGRTFVLKLGPDYDTATNPGYGYRASTLKELIQWAWEAEEAKAYPQG